MNHQASIVLINSMKNGLRKQSYVSILRLEYSACSIDTFHIIYFELIFV